MGYGSADRQTARGAKKRSKREKAPKWLYIRTFGGSDVALILNKRPFTQLWEFMTHYRRCIGILSRDRSGAEKSGSGDALLHTELYKIFILDNRKINLQLSPLLLFIHTAILYILYTMVLYGVIRYAI